MRYPPCVTSTSKETSHCCLLNAGSDSDGKPIAKRQKAAPGQRAKPTAAAAVAAKRAKAGGTPAGRGQKIAAAAAAATSDGDDDVMIVSSDDDKPTLAKQKGRPAGQRKLAAAHEGSEVRVW